MARLNKILWLCCALLLVAGDALAQQALPPSSWEKYRVADDEFSIALPTMPAMFTYHMKRRTQRYLGVYADGVVYTIYSDNEDTQKGLKNSLELLRLGQGLGWDAATEHIVNCDDVTGKQYTSNYPLGGVVQFFATKKHFYRIQAFGATAADARVQRFFSSLTFGKSEGIEVIDGPGTPFEPTDGSVQIPAASVFGARSVDLKSMILMKPEARYTEAAREKQVVGTVVLKAAFSANGSVVNIQVIQGLPEGLTEQAIEAIKMIKFIPAMKEGKRVSMWMQLAYTFELY